MGDLNVLQDIFPTTETTGDVMPDLRRFRDEHQFMIGANANTPNQIPRVLFTVLIPNTIAVIRHMQILYNSNDNISFGWTGNLQQDHSGGLTDGRDGRGAGVAGNPSAIFAGNNQTGAIVNPFVTIPNMYQNPFVLPNVDIVIPRTDTTGNAKTFEVAGNGVSASPNLVVLCWGYQRPVEPAELIFS